MMGTIGSVVDRRAAQPMIRAQVGGGPWKDPTVRQVVPSDHYLMRGYDRKTQELPATPRPRSTSASYSTSPGPATGSRTARSGCRPGAWSVTSSPTRPRRTGSAAPRIGPAGPRRTSPTSERHPGPRPDRLDCSPHPFTEETTLRPKPLSRLAAALLISALANAAAAAGAETPNPGLKYYYPVPAAKEPKTIQVDVCVYGGTPGGVAAAVQARRMGKTAALAVFRRHVGGLTSAGLTAVDLGKAESIGGMALEFLDARRASGPGFPARPTRGEDLPRDARGGRRARALRAPACKASTRTATASRPSRSRTATPSRRRCSSMPPTRATCSRGRRHLSTSAAKTTPTYGETVNGFQIAKTHQFRFADRSVPHARRSRRAACCRASRPSRRAKPGTGDKQDAGVQLPHVGRDRRRRPVRGRSRRATTATTSPCSQRYLTTAARLPLGLHLQARPGEAQRRRLQQRRPDLHRLRRRQLRLARGRLRDARADLPGTTSPTSRA